MESEQLKQEWSSPIYAFFAQEPTIEYVEGQHMHVFWCMAKGCKKGVQWFLDKSDAQLTGNMHKHVRGCWGEDIFHQATQTKNATVAHEAVQNYVKNGSIKVTLDCKGKVGYSHRQHTKIETRYLGRPFEIVGDPGFQTLMKTGHPEYHIPSPDTVACDVLSMFAHMWQQLAVKLQSYTGKLSFGTDTWTSPNHKAFMAVTVHLIEKGKPLGMPLDFFEVTRVHLTISIALPHLRLIAA
ncbi:hypothetical protein EDD16DRAFT_1488628 [Pisolithus croceorrhizus]|nr:hypothetical protein EDD16DRAFT_1488628 [Pisolithus croceorrhizus]KAI6111690.1 hypothetical protein EV401DRAFT_1868259 [Pisolithus croceorrhizus]KAI6158381.1 hypothetical protein EDD17DRAFT_1488768 [Pisolithus thermaeus]